MISIRANESDGDIRRVYFRLELLDGSQATGENGGQPQISINGAAFVNSANTLVHLTGDSYYLELSQSEVNIKDGSVIESRYENVGVTFAASGTTAQITEATNKEIYDRFDELAPLQHFMEASSSVVEGSVISGTYLLTQIEDGSYWITAPDAVNGLEQVLDFDIGTGRVPSLIEITGYWKSTPPTGFVDVDIYDHEISDWVQLSTLDNRLESENSNQDYIFIPKSSQVDPVTGLVQIRLRSESVGANDRLRIDKMVVDSFASGSAGLTPANIAAAVWGFKPGDVHDHDTTAFGLRAASLSLGEVTAVTDAQNFQLLNMQAAADTFKGALVYVHDETNDVYHKGVIATHDASGNVTLADPLDIVPEVGDGFILFNYNFNPAYDSVDVGTIGGSPVAGDVVSGVFQVKVTVKEGRDAIVFTGDSPTLNLVAPEGWNFTGKRVFFSAAEVPGGARKIDNQEATVTGITSAEVTLLDTDLDTVETYEAEFIQTDADGVSNVLTIARFRLAVRQDL